MKVIVDGIAISVRTTCCFRASWRSFSSFSLLLFPRQDVASCHAGDGVRWKFQVFASGRWHQVAVRRMSSSSRAPFAVDGVNQVFSPKTRRPCVARVSQVIGRRCRKWHGEVSFEHGRCEEEVKLRYGLRAVRVGEASRPGPP